MSNQKDSAEKEFYKPILQWMKEYFGCFAAGETIGPITAKIDIVGICDISGNRSGEVEVIGIEVKKDKGNFAKSVGQAYGYSAFVNRVYLAVVCDEFSSDEIRIAEHLGVGLIRVEHKSKKITCETVRSSPRYAALDRYYLDIISRLHYCKCSLCGNFIEIPKSKNGYSEDKYKTNYNTEAFNYRNIDLALKDEQPICWWNYVAGKRKKTKTNPRATELYDTFEKRHLCADCLLLIRAIGSPKVTFTVP